VAIATTYPGVYVEEIPSGVRTITGVATSITAFVGRARRGPVNKATTINNFGDFERIFGGLWEEYPMSYAVRDFYGNQGRQAVIVRVIHPNVGNEDPADDARNAAQDVADAAAGAVAGAANAQTVVDAAKAEAAKNVSEPRKSAAEAVVAKAVAAAAAGGATPQAVADAAAAAVKGAAAAALADFPVRASVTLGGLVLEAESEGEWGNRLSVRVDYGVTKDNKEAQRVASVDAADLFNLAIFDAATGRRETYLNTSLKTGRRQLDKLLENDSHLMRVAGKLPEDGKRPPDTDTPAIEAAKSVSDAAAAAVAGAADPKAVADAAKAKAEDGANKEEPRKTAAQGVATAAKDEAAKPSATKQSVADAAKKAADDVGKKPPFSVDPDPRSIAAAGGADGGELDADDVVSGEGLEDKKKGLFALEDTDMFNLLCIPEDSRGGFSATTDYPGSVYAAALEYCVRHRAMLLVDPPGEWGEVADITGQSLTELGLAGVNARNAALYFPRIKEADPKRSGQIDTFVPSGMLAGVMARTDTQRGVWKAPAGTDASLDGTIGLAANLTDDENGLINPLGVNALRAFPIFSRVVWGARTMRGADQAADEYKYVPVRRMALFLEESLYRGLKWVVFEPNADPLWASIRLNVGAFMHNLFRQGAFAGTTPSKAYFVRCDGETTTQNDIDLGIVNVVVGFAPLKPAEFVVLQIQQIAGQIET
jgi:Bacteriophage tail sheath protein